MDLTTLFNGQALEDIATHKLHTTKAQLGSDIRLYGGAITDNTPYAQHYNANKAQSDRKRGVIDNTTTDMHFFNNDNAFEDANVMRFVPTDYLGPTEGGRTSLAREAPFKAEVLVVITDRRAQQEHF